MQTLFLIDSVTGNIVGEPVKLDRNRQNMPGNMPMQIRGIVTATVQLQSTLDTDLKVRDGTAIWTPIANGTYTADVCDSLFVAFPYIRAVVTGYSSGTISVLIDR